MIKLYPLYYFEMEKNPFFSIVIPTHNRAKYLKITIKSILTQDFDDYELIISDNASTDDTCKTVKSFKSKKIRYYRNKDNIGFARNFYKAIEMAKGEYIITLGDDDAFLFEDTLRYLSVLINKKKYGYIRLKFYIHNTFSSSLYSFINFDKINKRYISKNASTIDIYSFIYSSIFFFIGGLVFKNNKKIVIKSLETTNNNNFLMEQFWAKFIYSAIKSKNGYIDTGTAIIANFSKFSKPSDAYAVIDGRIFSEKTWDLFFDNMTPKEKRKWIKQETENLVSIFPSIKYYSNRVNLLMTAKRICELNNNLLYNPKLYFFLITALLMPRSLWNLLRKIFLESRRVKDSKILNAYALFKKDVLVNRKYFN